MRSAAEVTFRIRQEAANLFLLASQPKFAGNQDPPLRVLPESSSVTAALRGSEYSQSVEAIAHSIMQHRFPVLGLTLETGPEIHWRRDYLHGKESGTEYFRRIPYL